MDSMDSNRIAKYINKYNSLKNKDEVAEIEYIQQEIQLITRKIEREKNNLMILEERHTKQKKEYDKLEGRPTYLTKEEKEQRILEKKRRMKRRKISDQLQSKTVRKDFADEENAKVQKQTKKIEINLDVVTKEIDKVVLVNEDLKQQIDDLRKEKTKINNQLEALKVENSSLQDDLDEIRNKNQENQKRIKFKELQNVKDECLNLQQSFESNRDKLEGKYHEIIEENIKREREHKREMSQKRLVLGKIADRVKRNQSCSKIEDNFRAENNEEMSDREPILDVLLEKWKNTIKMKKQILTKYLRNASYVKEVFDKLVKYLGVDNYDDLPYVFKKNAQQLERMEIYNSDLGNEVMKLENEKKQLEGYIDRMKKGIQELSEENINNETKDKSNESIQETTNASILEGIRNRRNFLTSFSSRALTLTKKSQEKGLSEEETFEYELNKMNKEITAKLELSNPNFAETSFYPKFRTDIKNRKFNENILKWGIYLANKVDSNDPKLKKLRMPSNPNPI